MNKIRTSKTIIRNFFTKLCVQFNEYDKNYSNLKRVTFIITRPNNYY